MKTFGPKSLSSFFFYLSRIGFFIVVGCCLFILLHMILGFFSYWLAWENSWVSLELEPRFYLDIKGMGLSISGSESLELYVPLLILASLTFYLLTAWHLSQLFKGLKQEIIFAEPIVRSLKALSLLFFISTILAVLRLVLSPYDDADIFAAFLLLVISGILFFIKEIFKQGLIIQNEHKLTI